MPLADAENKQRCRSLINRFQGWSDDCPDAATCHSTARITTELCPNKILSAQTNGRQELLFGKFLNFLLNFCRVWRARKNLQVLLVVVHGLGLITFFLVNLGD